MSKFFEETMQGLLETIEIEKCNIPLTEREGMPAKTFYVADIIDLETHLSDGRLTESSNGSRFEWRRMIEEVKKKGSPLTEEGNPEWIFGRDRGCIFTSNDYQIGSVKVNFSP